MKHNLGQCLNSTFDPLPVLRYSGKPAHFKRTFTYPYENHAERAFLSEERLAIGSQVINQSRVSFSKYNEPGETPGKMARSKFLDLYEENWQYTDPDDSTQGIEQHFYNEEGLLSYVAKKRGKSSPTLTNLILYTYTSTTGDDEPPLIESVTD